MAIFTDLPLELQHMILKKTLRLYNETDLPERLEDSLDEPNIHYKIRDFRKRHDGRALALVCKSWAEFISRRTLCRIYLRNPKRLGSEIKFMKTSNNVQRFCRDIELGLGLASQKKWFEYIRQLWEFAAELDSDTDYLMKALPGMRKDRKQRLGIELRGKLNKPFRRAWTESLKTRDQVEELPVVNAVDTLHWGIGVGIEDEEFISRDSTERIYQWWYPEPFRLTMVFDSLPNLRNLEVQIPDSFGENPEFHEKLALEISKWPLTIRDLNFSYQRKRPVNRVREPVPLAGVEGGMAATFRALVAHFSPYLENFQWLGRVSLDLLEEKLIRHAQWPHLIKIRIDYANVDLSGSWLFDLQRRHPDPENPERSEDGYSETSTEQDSWEDLSSQLSSLPFSTMDTMEVLSDSDLEDIYEDSSDVEMWENDQTAHDDVEMADPDNEYTARFYYNRSKPRKVALDRLHRNVFSWTRNMPSLHHLCIMTDSERNHSNVQLRVLDRGRALLFYNTEGNSYYPDEKVLKAAWAKDQWDSLEIEECADVWGTCDINMRYSPIIFATLDDDDD